MNSSERYSYVGTSDVGNIAEALDAAIAKAKETIPTDAVRWKLVSIDGVNGGFINKNEVSVTISATPGVS